MLSSSDPFQTFPGVLRAAIARSLYANNSLKPSNLRPTDHRKRPGGPLNVGSGRFRSVRQNKTETSLPIERTSAAITAVPAAASFEGEQRWFRQTITPKN
jgi:hypothetical protein